MSAAASAVALGMALGVVLGVVLAGPAAAHDGRGEGGRRGGPPAAEEPGRRQHGPPDHAERRGRSGPRAERPAREAEEPAPGTPSAPAGEGADAPAGPAPRIVDRPAAQWQPVPREPGSAGDVTDGGRPAGSTPYAARPGGEVLPVLPLGAGLACLGAGVGLVGLRLRQAARL